jgi:hypothetical protein
MADLSFDHDILLLCFDGPDGTRDHVGEKLTARSIDSILAKGGDVNTLLELQGFSNVAIMTVARAPGASPA